LWGAPTYGARRVRGFFQRDTPHPPSLRSGILSHKGRGKELRRDDRLLISEAQA
jgi:hypothetical protein